MPIYSIRANGQRVIYMAPIEHLSDIQLDYTNHGFDEVTFEYSYSFDSSNWSDWVFDALALLSAINADISVHTQTFVRIRISTITLQQSQDYSYFTLNAVLLSGYSWRVDFVEMPKSNLALDVTIDKNVFNPYRNVENAHALHKQLSKGVAQVIGLPAVYFRTEPDKESSNITFKHYKLHNTVDFKTIKYNLVDNSLPSNRFQYDEWNVGFLDEMEIHIVKEVFWEVFGQDIEPNSKDFIYLHLTNRMYKINTAFDDKGKFMNKAVWWSATLVKYEDGASVKKEGDAAEQLTEFFQDIDTFAKDIQNEEIETAEGAYEQNNYKVDEIPTAMKSTSEELIINGLPVFERLYKLDSVATGQTALLYDFTSIDEYGVAFWFKPKSMLVETLICTINNEQSSNALRLYLSPTGFLRLDATSNIRTVNLLTIGEAMTNDSLYGIVFNYVCNSRGKRLTLSVYDKTGEALQENSTETFDKLLSTKSFEFNGCKAEIANLRISKKFISKNKMFAVLTDRNPDMKSYYAVDNNVPTILSDKYANNN